MREAAIRSGEETPDHYDDEIHNESEAGLIHADAVPPITPA
ncbi:MAG: hypothetical protein ACYDGR_10020 [Candidatus Dormibacteria bacterium]